jgi:hypothetical protein
MFLTFSVAACLFTWWDDLLSWLIVYILVYLDVLVLDLDHLL